MKVKKRYIKKIFRGILGLLVIILYILPLLWVFATSMRSSKESFRLPPSFWPTEWNFDNYKQVFEAIPVWKYTFNSLFVAGLATLTMVLFTSLAAYALCRLKLRFSNVIYTVFLAGMMIPSSALLVPQFNIAKQLGIMNSKWTLVLLGAYYPIGLLMMRQMMMSIPKSYDEAAYMDGAGTFWVYLRVILPMSRPAIMTSAVMCFIVNWNDYLRPLILLSEKDNYTLPLAMQFLKVSRGDSNMSLILAAVILTMIPPLFIYIFAQRYLIQGAITAGIKG